MGLFDAIEERNVAQAQPLAARMRPQNLEEFVGQRHFLGEGKLLRRILQADRLSSLVFYGPAGTGKTSLAELVARKSSRAFVSLNAAACGVKEVRTAIDQARDRLAAEGRRTILFIDELHHFSRVQQDVLLPEVESGVVSLIGATTSNPFFALVSPLISRSQVFEFQPLTTDDVLQLLERAMHDRKRGLADLSVEADPEALEFLAKISDGDARRALTALEIGVRSLEKTGRRFDLATAEESIQKKAIRYDADGDDHYDAASAFIKSMRGSDPDAAIYWMARMLVAGEDPRFVARRIVICAAEDVSNADPMALVLAQAAAEATERLGMPECRIPLAQAVTYIACAPKSNSAIAAIDAAMQDVETQSLLHVPMHLRDAHYGGDKRMGQGQNYQYAHNSADGWVDQDYLGVERTYYQPVDRGVEAELAQRLEEIRTRRSRSPQSDE